MSLKKLVQGELVPSMAGGRDRQVQTLSEKESLLEFGSLQEHRLLRLTWCTLCLFLWGASSAKKRKDSSPAAKPRGELCVDQLTQHHHPRTEIVPWTWARYSVGWFDSHPCPFLSPSQKWKGGMILSPMIVFYQCLVCNDTPVIGFPLKFSLPQFHLLFSRPLSNSQNI